MSNVLLQFVYCKPVLLLSITTTNTGVYTYFLLAFLTLEYCDFFFLQKSEHKTEEENQGEEMSHEHVR